MMDFKLKDNDIVVDNGDISLCDSDVDFMGQALAIRLKTILGECFLDKNIGVPYLENILGFKNKDFLLKKYIYDVAVNHIDIKEITDFRLDLEHNTRKVLVSFRAILSNESSIAVSDYLGV